MRSIFSFTTYITKERMSKLSEEERLAEEEHFAKILKCYRGYGFFAKSKLFKMKSDFEHLSKHQRDRLLPSFPEKLRMMGDAIERNESFINTHLVKPNFSAELLKGESEPDNCEESCMAGCPPVTDMENVCSSLRQFVRDWSLEGEEERRQCYGRILSFLESSYPIVKERKRMSILVPGAGLGRLAYEIAHLGFRCQGNEFSYYMLLGAELMLNRSKKLYEYSISPFVLQVSNISRVEDQVREIKIPDIVPELSKDNDNDTDNDIDNNDIDNDNDIDNNNDDDTTGASSSSIPPFSMVAGDFLEVYAQDFQCWDVIVTCFFLDTAKNVITYLDYLHRMLKPGGRWINFGPLLYHFESSSGDCTLELTADELCKVIESYPEFEWDFKYNCNDKEDGEEVGFCMSPYARNEKSMFKFTYDCLYFCVRKKA